MTQPAISVVYEFSSVLNIEGHDVAKTKTQSDPSFFFLFNERKTLTHLLLSLSCRVLLRLAVATCLVVFFHQHALQTGPEQCRHTNGLFSSGAVDNDGVQTTKTITFQQGN